MPFTDDKLVVYLGYPAEVSDIPKWMSSLLRSEMENAADSPFRFYLSGGSVTPELLSLLETRGTVSDQAQAMSIRMSRGFPSRLIDALLSPDVAKIVDMANKNPNSVEFRVLLDLYVLSRSDVYLVDCNLLGGGRCGMEVVYSHDTIATLGVVDSSSVDPWYHYHIDLMLKSQMVSSYLNLVRENVLSSRLSLSKSTE